MMIMIDDAGVDFQRVIRLTLRLLSNVRFCASRANDARLTPVIVLDDMVCADGAGMRAEMRKIDVMTFACCLRRMNEHISASYISMIGGAAMLSANMTNKTESLCMEEAHSCS